MDSHDVFLWTGRSVQRWTNNANWRVYKVGAAKLPPEQAGPNLKETNAATFEPDFLKKHACGEKP
jgi:hypothetical protein